MAKYRTIGPVNSTALKLHGVSFHDTALKYKRFELMLPFAFSNVHKMIYLKIVKQIESQVPGFRRSFAPKSLITSDASAECVARVACVGISIE